MRNCKCHPNRKTSTATTNVYISETIFNVIEIELYPLFILMNLITSSFPHSASSLCLFLSLSSTISLLPTYLLTPNYRPDSTYQSLPTCLPILIFGQFISQSNCRRPRSRYWSCHLKNSNYRSLLLLFYFSHQTTTLWLKEWTTSHWVNIINILVHIRIDTSHQTTTLWLKEWTTSHWVNIINILVHIRIDTTFRNDKIICLSSNGMKY